MKRYDVVIAGDGIGPELTDAVVEVLHAVATKASVTAHGATA